MLLQSSGAKAVASVAVSESLRRRMRDAYNIEHFLLLGAKSSHCCTPRAFAFAFKCRIICRFSKTSNSIKHRVRQGVNGVFAIFVSGSCAHLRLTPTENFRSAWKYRLCFLVAQYMTRKWVSSLHFKQFEKYIGMYIESYLQRHAPVHQTVRQAKSLWLD